MFPGVSGFSPIPRKMSGSAINTMDWLMKTMSVPRVMVKRATHLYLDWPARGRGSPVRADRRLSSPCRRGAWSHRKYNVNVRVIDPSRRPSAPQTQALLVVGMPLRPSGAGLTPRTWWMEMPPSSKPLAEAAM